MSAKNLRVLMIAEQCNPDWVSVPLVSYNFYREVSNIVDVTLVTHGRNQIGFEKHGYKSNVTYIQESPLLEKYHHLIGGLIEQGQTNWPLYNALAFPIYAEFDRAVYRLFNQDVKQGKYDVVHVITPMMPRYPVSLIRACQHTPLLLGPVNGGVPFPKGFEATAKKEKVFWNFLRPFGRHLIPGYVDTYKNADKILSASTYTLQMLKDLFAIDDDRIELFYENGIPSSFINKVARKKDASQRIEVLFAGRLVPYKGADILIEAVSKISSSVQQKILLTIVGDGSERAELEQQVIDLNLKDTVKFVGWVKQQETAEYYSKADIFCFPSIREFGGAVVMEAMACGLPCIVVNNGGVAEYVTDETGFKIDPVSRDYLVAEVADKLKLLVEDEELRDRMSIKAVERAQDFEWSAKGKKMVEVYQQLSEQKCVLNH